MEIIRRGERRIAIDITHGECSSLVSFLSPGYVSVEFSFFFNSLDASLRRVTNREAPCDRGLNPCNGPLWFPRFHLPPSPVLCCKRGPQGARVPPLSAGHSPVPTVGILGTWLHCPLSMGAPWSPGNSGDPWGSELIRATAARTFRQWVCGHCKSAISEVCP